MFTNLNWFVLIAAWLIDSINPCAIWVLVFLLAFLAESNKTPWQLIRHGLVYVFAVFLVYLLAGVFLLPIIQSLGNFSTNAYLVFAIIVGIFWVLELKEYFRPGEWSILEIPPRYSKKIKQRKEKILESYPFTFLMWGFVALVELPCTWAVYLAILALMAKWGVSAENVIMLIVYNILFVLPLIIILYLFYKWVSSDTIQAKLEKYKPHMRLATWLLLIGLAAWMIHYAYF